MRKVNYPFETDSEKERFLNDYFDKLFPKISEQKEINEEIKAIDATWDLKKLLTADFCQLVEFAQKAKSLNIDALDLHFKWESSKKKYLYLYTSMQRSISDFLIKKDVNIKTCFYCNIEYINSFKNKYSSVEELINFAPFKLLKTIINEPATSKITAKRKLSFIFEKDLKSLFPRKGVVIVQKLKNNYNEEFYEEHFTLDHVFPKNSHAFLSISIFKLIKEFTINNDLKNIVPSSKDYVFDKFIEFKIKYLNKTSKIERLEDVDINVTNLSSFQNIDEFIGIFKLQNRYKYHKSISYNMLQKRKIYSDSQIKEIAKLLKRDEQSIKEDLFGKECFHSNNEPFEKYKQDIAEQLGLI